MPANCKGCRFWAPDAHGNEKAGYHYGDCRRMAPVPAMGGQVRDESCDTGRDPTFIACWPQVDYEDWCGEFKPKQVVYEVEPQELDPELNPASLANEINLDDARREIGSVAVRNMLCASGMNDCDDVTIEELVKKMSAVHIITLTRMRGCGKQSVKRICKFVRDRGGRVQGDDE